MLDFVIQIEVPSCQKMLPRLSEVSYQGKIILCLH